MRSLQDRAVDLISQPPAARAARDIEMVLPWLQKRSKLLMELDRGKEKHNNRQINKLKKKYYVIVNGPSLAP
jgi:hypothetical protein